MSKEKHDSSKHCKPHHVQRARLEETKVLAEQGASIPQRHPLMQQISRMGNIPNPGAHAAILNRTRANQLSSNRQLLLQLQRQYGNSYVQQVMQQMQQMREIAPSASTQQPLVQAKLTIGEPGDRYELEADKVARQVVQQINAPASVQSAQSQTVQRQALEEKKDSELQMKPVVQLQANTEMAAAPDLEASINQAKGSGQPLADNIREPMEQAFGADFSGVKVHTDHRADQLNQSIHAKAFTTGQDVFFRQGEYNPGSRGGQELLAHELTHVVQQNSGAVQRLQRTVISPQLTAPTATTRNLLITSAPPTFGLSIQTQKRGKKGNNSSPKKYDSDRFEESDKGKQDSIQKKMVEICKIVVEEVKNFGEGATSQQMDNWYEQVNLNGLCGGWVEIHKRDLDIEKLWEGVKTWEVPDQGTAEEKLLELKSHLDKYVKSKTVVKDVVNLLTTAWNFMNILEPKAGYGSVPGNENREYVESMTTEKVTMGGVINITVDKSSGEKNLKEALSKKIGKVKNNKHFIAHIESKHHHMSMRVECREGRLDIVVNEPQKYGIIKCGDDLDKAVWLLVGGILEVEEGENEPYEVSIKYANLPLKGSGY